ncbi:hypothetical protein KDL01_06875 [Actinospica durhamensis]|uniref:Uncharacterized protein n=1 Tax=Actinospica durhamensis TaxID=1508375 RepID=A0A941IQJ0_9ACTN|nr:hypothetical protein [Actinospica durhamensis]MBR7832978.1 hypothetical protein [Actinospica durhamensis]
MLREPDPGTALEAIRRDLSAYAHGPLTDAAALLLLRYRDVRDGFGWNGAGVSIP